MRTKSIFLFCVYCLVQSPIWGQTNVTYTSSKATDVHSGITGVGSGTGTTIEAGRITFLTGYATKQAFVEFDLSSIPTNAVITSATLKMFKTGNTGTPTIYTHRNTGYWDEFNLGWSNRPTYSTSDQIVSSTTVSGWVEISVTSHVQKMVAGIVPNYGWVLRHSNEAESAAKSMSFAADEYSGTANDPKLSVSYYIPMSVSAATIIHESAVGESDGSISPVLAGGPGGTYTYTWYNSTGVSIGNSLTLSNVPYGWYGLEVTNSGMSTFYYAFLVGLNCKEVSIPFNPGPNYVSDAMIYDLVKSGINYGENNYGSYSRVSAESWTSTNWYDLKSLFKFNLWIDNSINLSEADLELISASHYPLNRTNESELVKVTSAWSEFGVTYNTAPTLSTNTADKILLPATANNGENLSLDISNFWNDWKQDNLTNNGLILQLQSYTNSYTRRAYHSSDVATQSDWPKMSFKVSVFDSECLSYKELKRSLDGGYAISMGGVIRFTMDEEYEMEGLKYLPIRIYNADRELLESTDIDGNVLNSSISPLELAFDDNRWELDISGVAGISVGEYYTLEVLTSKGDKRYLRFLYKN